MNLDKEVRVEVHDKALLQAMLNTANSLVPKEDEISIGELVTVANLRPDIGNSAMADGTFQLNVVVFTDASGKMKHLCNNNVDSGQLPITWRNVKTNEDCLAYLKSVHEFVAHKWCLRRYDGEEWPCNLEGETGKSRLLTSAAVRYLLDCCFKVVDGDNVIQCKRRTKLIEVGDVVEFYIIRVLLYPQYNYSRGVAYCKKVKINFVDSVISSGREEELSIEELQLERDIQMTNDNQQQSYDSNEPDYDDQEYERSGR